MSEKVSRTKLEEEYSKKIRPLLLKKLIVLRMKKLHGMPETPATSPPEEKETDRQK